MFHVQSTAKKRHYEFVGELTAANFAFLYEWLDLLPAATFLLDDFDVTGAPH
jgi:hypothetical protein